MKENLTEFFKLMDLLRPGWEQNPCHSTVQCFFKDDVLKRDELIDKVCRRMEASQLLEMIFQLQTGLTCDQKFLSKDSVVIINFNDWQSFKNWIQKGNQEFSMDLKTGEILSLGTSESIQFVDLLEQIGAHELAERTKNLFFDRRLK